MSLSIEDVKSAAQRLAGKAIKTPLVECHLLSEQINGRVFIKAECLQRTGSFKFRVPTSVTQLAATDRSSDSESPAHVVTANDYD